MRIDTCADSVEHSTAAADLPTGSIVERHFYGVGASLCDNAIANIRRTRLVERVHQLGPRPSGELLLELCAAWGVPIADLDERLSRYAALDAGIVRALGADVFPNLPLREIA